MNNINIKELKEKILTSFANKNEIPHLAIVTFNCDPASKIYIKNKKKSCAVAGIEVLEISLSEEISQEDLNSLLDNLSIDKDIDGIILQLPIPKKFNEDIAISHISPKKDVDGLTPENIGLLHLGKPRFIPCTAEGIVTILDTLGIDCDGKHAVVVGRSKLVGMPIKSLLDRRGATVTGCHSHTKNLADVTRKADILIVAVGKAKMITADMVKSNAVVIDVGINKDENGKTCGDVDYENVKNIASYITPVPGGVGQMTVAMLIENTYLAYDLNRDRSL